VIIKGQIHNLIAMQNTYWRQKIYSKVGSVWG
jgi:hypothetical protein